MSTTASADKAKLEMAKKQAAITAVNTYVQNHQVIGVGTGSTTNYAIERLIERVREEKLDLWCVPTSKQTKELLEKGGLKVGDLKQHPELDVAIDGADEADAQLNLIKGGGGAHTQEKIVASCAKKFIVIADYRKDSKTLGEQWKQGIPVEVIPLAVEHVSRKLAALGAKPHLRVDTNGIPFVTDNGNNIIDADFGLIENPAALETKINALTGVVDNGLFVGMAAIAYFGNADGTVSSREPK